MASHCSVIKKAVDGSIAQKVYIYAYDAVDLTVRTLLFEGTYYPARYTASPAASKTAFDNAACTLAATLPASLSTNLALAPTAQRFMMPPAASFSGFIPSSPERPPRFSPA